MYELNYFQHRVTSVDPSVQTSAFEELHKFLYADGRFDWTLQLDRLMTENGFEDAVLHQYINMRMVSDMPPLAMMYSWLLWRKLQRAS